MDGDGVAMLGSRRQSAVRERKMMMSSFEGLDGVREDWRGSTMRTKNTIVHSDDVGGGLEWHNDGGGERRCYDGGVRVLWWHKVDKS